MTLQNRFEDLLGAEHVLTGSDIPGSAEDWTGKFHGMPAIYLRPADTSDVSAIMRICHETQTPITAISGGTSLTGATHNPGGVVLSVERLNTIEDINPRAGIARVGAGVVLQDLRNAANDQGMAFPVTFGAQGSARIGGILSTNAGGSNVLRFGNTRDLCLGIEVVMANGEVMNLMSALHKNNSGYDLRHLMIGAEGTLGIITRAVVKLVPNARARATAMVATPDLGAALDLLNRMQTATDGTVEAFEYMPGAYIEWATQKLTHLRAPFSDTHNVNIMIELAATSDRDCTPNDDGTLPLTELLEAVLGEMFEEGLALDAVIAQNDTQRADLWAMREAAGEVMFTRTPLVDTDICVQLDLVKDFLELAPKAVNAIDAEAETMAVAHLGDGNIHFTIYPTKNDPDLKDRVMEAVEQVSQDLGGSFSAEHGVGLSKLPSMRRRKDPVALATMRSIKAALDPKNILNPGKLIPEA